MLQDAGIANQKKSKEAR